MIDEKIVNNGRNNTWKECLIIDWPNKSWKNKLIGHKSVGKLRIFESGTGITLPMA